MKLFTNSDDENTSLGVVERTAYGAGNFGCGFMFVAVATYLTFYYTNIIGLNAGVIGTIMLVSRVLDGITDLIMGYIIDHSKQTKLGKARSWMLKSCIPYALSGVILFMVPQGASDVAKYVFIFLTYNLYNSICYTALQVSYNTILVKITHNPLDRGLLGIFQMVGATIGGLIVTSTCLTLVNRFGGDARAWTLAVLIYAVIGLAAHIFCVFGTRERIRDEAPADSAEGKTNAKKLGFIESFGLLVRNKYWLMIAGAFATYWIAYTLNSSGAIYFAQYVLGSQDYQPAMANVIQVVTLVGMIGAFVPIKYFGKGMCTRLGLLVTLAGLILQVFFAHNYAVILVCSGLKGLGWGLFCGAIGGMTPDALDYGQWKLKKDVSGMGVAAVTFGQKIGTGLGGAIFGLVLNAGGYDGTAAVQSTGAIRAIAADFTYLPLVLTIVSLLCVLGYNLDKRLPQIQADLKEGKYNEN